MGKKGGSAPKPPDPYKTAAAEAQFNRADEYRPGGGGVRYGYTDAEGLFRQGKAPEGFQSAVTSIESPTESHVRQGLEWQAANNMNNLGVAPTAPTAAGFGRAPGVPSTRNLPGAARFDAGVVPGLPGAPQRKGQAPDNPSRSNLPPEARFERSVLQKTPRPRSTPDDIPEIERALFDRSLSLMKPEIDRGRTRMQNDLQARGIPVGSEAWNEAVGSMERGTNESLDRLAQSATLAGGQEQSRRFGLDLTARDQNFGELASMFDMDARRRSTRRGEQTEDYMLRKDSRANKRAEQDQDYALQRDASDAAWNRALGLHDVQAGERATAIGEQDRLFNLKNAYRTNQINEGIDFYNLQRGQRDAALGEMAALMGGAYNPTAPASRIGGGAPVNYASMVQQNYANQVAARNAQQQNTNSMMGGLGSLGMAGYMMLSARAAKQRVGDMDAADALRAILAVPVERWRYRPDVADALYDDAEHVGPYADDWHAATGLGNGESISAIDLLGYLVAAVQALAAEVRRAAPNGGLFREVSHDCVA